MSMAAVFIDRDETIGGNGHYMGDQFKLFPSAQSAIQRLKTHHIPVFAFSNQTPIATGELQYQADMLAAWRAHASKILVETGRGKDSLTVNRSQWQETQPDFVAPNLYEAVTYLLRIND
ncbi:hypothetical protein ACLJJ6_01360 [Pediococcus siamensis]|uniref:hypothetical protein n=1 Tax=Pediococcus siamensis TaxID=381829 RepID=UPI0039A042FB